MRRIKIVLRSLLKLICDFGVAFFEGWKLLHGIMDDYDKEVNKY